MWNGLSRSALTAQWVPRVTTVSNPDNGFAVSLDLEGDQALFSLRGELDSSSAPELSGLLDAVIASGYPLIVMDLAGLDFMAGAGIEVIARAARRMAALDGQLCIRSPSAVVRRLLDGTGTSDLSIWEQSESARSDRRSKQPAGPSSQLSGPRSDALAQGLRRAAANPVSGNMTDGALRLVVALARATVGGADGVSVSLRRNGRLATVAASDQIIVAMDTDQYETGEGPCVDASTEGRWFHAESLDAEDRWPAFTPRALGLGINSILSSPLLAWKRPVGALNIYSRTESAFDPEAQKLAALFASEASTFLTDTGLDVTDDQRSARFQEALHSRAMISRAEGVVMERTGISGEDAFTALRVSSQQTGRPLRTRAEEIVTSTSRSAAVRGRAIRLQL